jgi:hypothetical protein
VAIILPSACSIIEEPVYNISSNPVPTLKESSRVRSGFSLNF